MEKAYIIEMNFNADGKDKFMQTFIKVRNPDTLLADMVDNVKNSYPDAHNIKIEKIFNL